MPQQTEFEQEMARLIVEALNLQDVRAEDIVPEEPLFGEGLGLDSIDALEIALAVGMQYGVQLRSDDENNREIFESLRSLSTYVGAQRKT